MPVGQVLPPNEQRRVPSPKGQDLHVQSIVRTLPAAYRQDLVELLEEATDVGTWDWDIVENRFCWSPRQYLHFGLQPPGDDSLTYEDWLAAIHADDRASVQVALADTIASGRPLDLTFRVLWRDDDAGKVDVHWLHARGRLIRGADGLPLRMVGTSRDVTETEERLARSRAERDAELADRFGGPTRFDVLFEAARDCLVQLKVEAGNRFTYQMINPAGLTMIGMTMAAAHGLTPVQVLGPVNGGLMEAALADVVATGLPVHFEPTFDYDGHMVIYDAIYMPLRDERGVVTAILCRARDVTDQRRTTLALQQAQKMDALGHLAAGITHDFNNVLTSLRGCFLRLARIDHSAETDRILDLGSKAIRQGEAVTRRLLAFVRKQEAAVTMIALDDCIRDAVQLLQSALPDVAITVQPMDDACHVVADAALLQSCLLNLGVNARDARPQGCRLTISTSIVDADFAPCGPADGAFAAICVRDNGPGMTAQVAARAFEPFYTTKDVGKGTGLGLSMVHGTVQGFGGTARIDTTPGAGTAVILYLRYA